MVRKRSPANKDVQPPRIDDLKLINGIGPAVEKRLNSFDITTYHRLAAMSPADVAAAVADLAGLSAERIIKQDWIGQARKLAAGQALTHSETPASVEPPVTIEQTETATNTVEPEQAHELTAETLSDVAQIDIEVPAEPEQILTATDSAEPSASEEQVPAVPSLVVSAVEPESAVPELETETDAASSIQQYRPATFSVEFLLDENNDVYSTHVMHLQGRREDTWKGWRQAQFINFLIENAGLSIPLNEPGRPEAEEHVYFEELVEEPAMVTGNETLAPLAPESGLTGTLQLRELEIIGVASGSSRRILAINDPFSVRLTLDLTGLQMPGDTPLNYKASLYGKSRGNPGLLLGEAQGTIIPADTVTIKVEENTLPEEGFYHLAATVIVGLPTMELSVRPGTTTVIDGGQVQAI